MGLVRRSPYYTMTFHCSEKLVERVDGYTTKHGLKKGKMMEHAINDRLEERGEIRYRDYSRTVWKYTFKGAFRACTRWTKMFRKSMAQSERANRKRPGDSL